VRKCWRELCDAHAIHARGKMNVNSSKVSYVAEVVLHELTAWIYEVKELVQ
jgi:hypothetical protein